METLIDGLTKVARVGSAEDFAMAHGSGSTSSCPCSEVARDTAADVEQVAEVMEPHSQHGQIEEAYRSRRASFWPHGMVHELRSGGSHW